MLPPALDFLEEEACLPGAQAWCSCPTSPTHRPAGLGSSPHTHRPAGFGCKSRWAFGAGLAWFALQPQTYYGIAVRDWREAGQGWCRGHGRAGGLQGCLALMGPLPWPGHPDVSLCKEDHTQHRRAGTGSPAEPPNSRAG